MLAAPCERGDGGAAPLWSPVPGAQRSSLNPQPGSCEGLTGRWRGLRAGLGLQGAEQIWGTEGPPCRHSE